MMARNAVKPPVNWVVAETQAPLAHPRDAVKSPVKWVVAETRAAYLPLWWW